VLPANQDPSPCDKFITNLVQYRAAVNTTSGLIRAFFPLLFGNLRKRYFGSENTRYNATHSSAEVNYVAVLHPWKGIKLKYRMKDICRMFQK
jgi:hypothetical protein